MPQKTDHDKNRKKVGDLYGSKIVFGKCKQSVFNLTNKLHKLVCKYCKLCGKNDVRYPTSICGNCRLG